MGELACAALGRSGFRAFCLTVEGKSICRFMAIRDNKIVSVGETIILVCLRLKG